MQGRYSEGAERLSCAVVGSGRRGEQSDASELIGPDVAWSCLAGYEYASPRCGAPTGARLLCRRLSAQSTWRSTAAHGARFVAVRLADDFFADAFFVDFDRRRFGITHDSRNAVSERGGVLLDEFA